MKAIEPIKIRFIKLGGGGEWEQSCIENNTVRLDYNSPHHQESLDGNWDVVRAYWLKMRNDDKGTATRDVNQIRDFYELKEDDVWITFYKRKMYWCHASSKVIETEVGGARIRNVIGKWSSVDKKGKELRIENIDGRVTQVQGFRGTICSVDLPEYLIRKINGETIAETENAKESLRKLKSDVEKLVQGLWWHDFELLVDLIFSNIGWQRVSVRGKTEKDIDLDVKLPATGKRAFVQIKSSTSREEIESCIEKYKGYDEFDAMYLVYHTCKSDLTGIEGRDSDVYLWDVKKISSLVVDTGLVEWLIDKRT